MSFTSALNLPFNFPLPLPLTTRLSAKFDFDIFVGIVVSRQPICPDFLVAGVKIPEISGLAGL